jgi:hypothetical protein
MTAYMTSTDDRETELLADALAQTYADAVLAQVGDHLPLTDEVFKVAWYLVAERAKELRRAPKQPRREQQRPRRQRRRPDYVVSSVSLSLR